MMSHACANKDIFYNNLWCHLGTGDGKQYSQNVLLPVGHELEERATRLNIKIVNMHLLARVNDVASRNLDVD